MHDMGENGKKIFGRKRIYTSIHRKVLFYIAWRNLTSKRLRSLLTIFGVVIGIGAIFFLMSFGLGLQHLVTTQVIGDQSIKSLDITSPNSKLIKLNDEAVNKIRTYPHVEKVGVQYSFPGSLKNQGAEIDSVVYGVDLNYQEISNLTLIAGRLLQNEDFKALVINTSAMEAIGIKDKDAALGQEIALTVPLQSVTTDKKEVSDNFKIVGVIDSGSGSEVFLPSAVFNVAGVEIYENARVIADNSSNVGSIRVQVQSSGFETTSPVDTLEQINQIFKFFTFILIGFGSVGMIVSILGMFNTMTISLLERTKEIGLMMALGARNSDMRKLFVFEAVIISFMGALIGIGLAICQGMIVNFFMNQFAKRRGVQESFMLFSFPLWAILLLTGFTVVVGLLVVFFPARRAQKIDPIDALRRE